MRKILLIFLIVILALVFGLMLVSGWSIGSFAVSSVTEIINQNNELDTEIQILQTEIDGTYVNAQASVESSYKKLIAAKQSYQEQITYSTDEEIEAANQTEEYEIGYLWTKIGLYATNNSITMKADVTNGSSGAEGQYNISFTVTGEYLSISEFIYAIENDSNLGFKIEEFALSPYSGDTLQATFVIKNISINPDTLTTSNISSSSTDDTEEDTADTTDTTEEETSEY